VSIFLEAINGRAALLRRPNMGKAAALPYQERIYEMTSKLL
jgi:hypothetical protein